MKERFKCIALSTAIFLIAANAAVATEIDCAAGDTITAALAGKGKTIAIKGVCDNEPDDQVTITKDDVTLTGITADAAVHGLIVVDGAQGAVIENLTVTAPLDGIYVTNGGGATIRNNRIVGNEGEGIAVIYGAFATIEFNEITGNGEVGVSAFRGATVRSRENTIEGHSFAGVEVAQHSAFMSQPRSGMPGDAITSVDPGTYAVSVQRHSYADLRDVAVIGNMSVSNSSELDIRGRYVQSTVDGDINAHTLSIVLKNNSRAGVEITGSCTGYVNSYCKGFW